MIVLNYLLSHRYKSDGVSLISSTNSQKNAIKEFLFDPRIKTETLTGCPLCAHQKALLVAESLY